jgi:hypothetical protein
MATRSSGVDRLRFGVRIATPLGVRSCTPVLDESPKAAALGKDLRESFGERTVYRPGPIELELGPLLAVLDFRVTNHETRGPTDPLNEDGL